MAETAYSFDVAATFPNGKVNTTTLAVEIGSTSIVTAIARIDTTDGSFADGVLTGGTCDVVFKAELSSADETALSAAIAAHQGASSPQVPLLREDGALYAVPKAAAYTYEMCDRDFRINTSLVDSKALLTVVNGANGSVTYVAARSGAHGNSHSISVVAGDTGVGYENRALSVSHDAEHVTVTFGTDGAGASVVPTAAEVATLINSDYSIALHLMSAVPSGDGSGVVATTTQTSLAGGSSASHEDLKIDVATLKEVPWGELSQVGVYKDNAGTMVECSDQTDADSNAILSVWDYMGVHPYTFDLMRFELRDGYLLVDPSIPAGERWDHRVYAIGAPLIPGSLGGSLRVFDGYMGPAPGGVIDAKSPQTFVMDPAKAPGASSIRLYIYHPAGSKLSHVLRLVTYRAPGTF